MCPHGDNPHQLSKHEIDEIIKDELMKSTDRFYMSHVPQIGEGNVDMRVVHSENERAMFPVKILKKLCKHSTAKQLLGFDVDQYVPSISESEYLKHHKKCYQRVLQHIQQDNDASRSLAIGRRNM
jgi:hypothetical protein